MISSTVVGQLTWNNVYILICARFTIINELKRIFMNSYSPLDQLLLIRNKLSEYNFK